MPSISLKQIIATADCQQGDNAMSDNADLFDLIVKGCANYAADLFELTEGYANYAEAAVDLLLGYVEQEAGLIEAILPVRE